MQPPHKPQSWPFQFVDYIDVVPGSKRASRLSAEERERLERAAEMLKESAKELGVTFKITKGDEQ